MDPIVDKYLQLGRSGGPLGPAVGATRRSSDRAGRLRRFARGAIYWHPEVGAYAIYGEILEKWLELGGEAGSLGYPTSDELASGHDSSRCSCFQRGRIYWSPERVLRVTDLASDVAVCQWIAFNARPAAQEVLDELAVFLHASTNDPVLDYSPDANFVRNQGTCGDAGYGCPLHALLNVVDILKDWEHPYTPAVSWRHAEWICEGWKNTHAGEAPNLFVPVLQGIAPEALCETNYDTQFSWLVTGNQSAGNVEYHPVWNEPSPAAMEAAVYRARIKANDQAVWVPPGEEGVKLIKAFLAKYGPLWSGHQGHARAIVGYDDTTRQFKILDSYTHEETGGHNLTSTSYDSIDGTSIQAVWNLPTPARVTGKHAFSARIRIEGTWRGTFTVSVGVEGKTPLVVYTTRGRDLPRPPAALDPSRFLRLDVPLPDYAASCWPPSARFRWFLRVEDHDRDGATGIITEFTLARRYQHPDCRSVGKYRTQTYGGAISVPVPDPVSGPIVNSPGPLGGSSQIPNPEPGVAVVYLPAKVSRADGGMAASAELPESISYNVHYAIELELPTAQDMAHIRGRVLKKRLARPAQPVAQAKITIFRLLQNTCVNKPPQWQRFASTVTDANGRFSIPIVEVGSDTEYYAVGLGSEPDELRASSDRITVQPAHLDSVTHFGP